MHCMKLAGLAATPLLLAALATPAAATTATEETAGPTTNTYAGSWNRTWRNGVIRTDTSEVVQGTVSGGRNVAQIGFPKLTQPGRKITEVKVTLYFRHWWYGSGGAADIGVHANAAKPATFKYSGSLTVSGWPRYTSKTVTLPAAWLPGWNSGNTKGITLGGKANANLLFYGRAAGVTDAYAWARPVIHVTSEPIPVP